MHHGLGLLLQSFVTTDALRPDCLRHVLEITMRFGTSAFLYSPQVLGQETQVQLQARFFLE